MHYVSVKQSWLGLLENMVIAFKLSCLKVSSDLCTLVSMGPDNYLISSGSWDHLLKINNELLIYYVYIDDMCMPSYVSSGSIYNCFSVQYVQQKTICQLISF